MTSLDGLSSIKTNAGLYCNQIIFSTSVCQGNSSNQDSEKFILRKEAIHSRNYQFTVERASGNYSVRNIISISGCGQIQTLVMNA